MSFNISERIVAGIIGELNKNAYIISNSIPVRDYRDGTQEKVSSEICVWSHLPFTDNDIYQGVWDSRTELICYTYTADDKKMLILRALVEACWDTITQNALIDFSQSGLIIFNGITMDEEHGENYDDNEQIIRLQLIVSVEDAAVST